MIITRFLLDGPEPERLWRCERCNDREWLDTWPTECRFNKLHEVTEVEERVGR